MNKLLTLLLLILSSSIFADESNFNFIEEVTPMCLSPISNRGEEYDELAEIIEKELNIAIKDDNPIDQIKFEKFKQEYVNNGNSEDSATKLAHQLLRKDKGDLLFEDTYKYIHSIEQAKKYGLGKVLSECINEGEVLISNDAKKGKIVSEWLDWGQRFYNVKNAQCSDYSNKIFDNETCIGLYSLRESYHNGGRSAWFEHEAIYIVHKYNNDFIVTPLKRRSPDDAFDDEFVDNCIVESQRKDDTEKEKNILETMTDHDHKIYINKLEKICSEEFEKIKSNRLVKPSILEAFK